MSSVSTQFAISRSMDMYEPFQRVSMWDESFKSDDGDLKSGATPILLANTTSTQNKSQCIPHQPRGSSEDDQDTNKAVNYKVVRRLAQNREAARKSRLRKKAYVEQLETSRLKLMQLELEIEKARKQGGLGIGGYVGSPGTINSGIGGFEIEYGHWVEEQDRQNAELRKALQSNGCDQVLLHLLVESALKHYSNLFKMKAEAAKADIFYLLCGAWKTSVERFFLWIGGSRPSQLLNMIVPQLEPLSEEQIVSVNNLRLSSLQAEDALSQGLDKLQYTLLHNIASDPYLLGFQMAATPTMDKIEALEDFVNQADHLREQTLQHMSRILTTHQAARGLLLLGEYFHHLRALTSLWAFHPPKLKSPNFPF
ncbi:transcription factor TGA7-like [Senna tora]|uniref:Transcription factor TGA7-like n=1 Tax=Senna tora TaxID=362788 RepID=A0A834WQH7_9FABA|nr:transcription factor TGA7-like [Senna tora]